MNLRIPAAAALFCVMYMLLGRRLGRIWGVDQSRPTPATETGKGKSAVLLLVRDAAVYGLFALGACRSLKASVPALAAIAAAVCLGGVISYAALFVSMRHEGKGVAMAAYWEMGRAAERIYHVLALGVCVPALALVLGRLYGLSGAGVCTEIPAPDLCALLFGLLALTPAQITAGQIRNEGEAGALCMGGVLIAGLTAAVIVLAGGTDALGALAGGVVGMEAAAAACLAAEMLAYLCASAVLVRLAFMSLNGLFRREFPPRRRLHPAAKAAMKAAAIAACAALCLYAWDAALIVCACASVLLALMSLAVCALWLHRIGRGLL